MALQSPLINLDRAEKVLGVIVVDRGFLIGMVVVYWRLRVNQTEATALNGTKAALRHQSAQAQPIVSYSAIMAIA